LFEESEKELLGNLQDSWGECPSTLWDLVIFCATTCQQERAVGFVERLMELSDNPDHRAICLIMLALLMEEMEDYDSAKGYYEQVLELEELEENTSYYLYNSLGCLLNKLRNFEEAQLHLERAISIDPERAYGHKDLGIACEGLGRLEEAVECYFIAAQLEPHDARSLVHLESLLSRHPELFVKSVNLQSRLDRCRKQVMNAQSEIPEVTIH
jgi:tetratricopeptide (TPR) repeat protein